MESMPLRVSGNKFSPEEEQLEWSILVEDGGSEQLTHYDAFRDSQAALFFEIEQHMNGASSEDYQAVAVYFGWRLRKLCF